MATGILFALLHHLVAACAPSADMVSQHMGNGREDQPSLREANNTCINTHTCAPVQHMAQGLAVRHQLPKCIALHRQSARPSSRRCQMESARKGAQLHNATSTVTHTLTHNHIRTCHMAHRLCW